jgi:para-nitrobenzyl esterase
MAKHSNRALLLGSALAVGLVSAHALAHNSGHGSGSAPVVNTDKGAVRGYVDNGVNVYLGIPYAAPPVDNLRWRPPQPTNRWKDTLDATEFANTCPQVTELGAFAGPTSTTEDCLYLNVFTTGQSHGSRGRGKPVIVWIHGGGNVDGETNDYDGTKLATGGPNGTPTVVVTINYRMGLFGFLSHPALNTGGAWGNYGILDQQAALRWVQRNIQAFGGDPGNVTLGGQSAGSQDTSANMISPSAAGLFHRAIEQSGPRYNLFQTGAVALQRGTAFATAAGCSNAACLRSLSAERILQLQGTPNANGPYVTGPFVDGNVIPLSSDDAWASGAYRHMPIIGGRTRDEAMFGLSITEYFSGPPQVALTPDQYAANNSAAVQAEYPLTDYNGNATLAQDRVGTDNQKCQLLQVMKTRANTNGGYPQYGYDFAYQHTPYYFPQMPNAYDATGHFLPLAYHTADIQFVFPKWHGGQLGVNLDQISGQPRELQGAEIGLSNQLVAAWTNFAATGNPNGAGVPSWPAMTAASPRILKQDISSSIYSESAYRSAYHCDFWDAQS